MYIVIQFFSFITLHNHVVLQFCNFYTVVLTFTYND